MRTHKRDPSPGDVSEYNRCRGADSRHNELNLFYITLPASLCLNTSSFFLFFTPLQTGLVKKRKKSICSLAATRLMLLAGSNPSSFDFPAVGGALVSNDNSTVNLFHGAVIAGLTSVVLDSRGVCFMPVRRHRRVE